MKRMLRPRRLLVALAIAVTLGSIGVAALGTESSTALADVPAAWSAPVPYQGDRGTYAYALLSKGTLVGEEVPYLGFEQAAASLERNGIGDPVLVNVLRHAYGNYEYSREDSNEQTSTYAWRLGASSGLAEATDGSRPFLDIDAGSLAAFLQGSNSSIDLPGLSIPLSSTQRDGGVLLRLYFDDALGPLFDPSMFLFCGSRSSLQGQTVNLQRDTVQFEPCHLAAGGVDPQQPVMRRPNEAEDDPFPEPAYDQAFDKGLDLRATGRQVLGSLDTAVFTRVINGEETNRRIHVWMAQEVPYPVQISIADGDDVHVLRLSRFERGSEPLATQGATGPPAPMFRMVSRQPWGLQDSGTALAVVPSDAWQAALEHGPLAAYLDTHSQAVTYQVRGNAMRNAVDASEQYEWWFALTDGVTAFGVTVHADVDALVPVPPLLGLGGPSLKAPASYSFDYTDAAELAALAPRVNASTAPQSAPTASSVLARWSAFAELDHPMATWELNIACADTAGILGFLSTPPGLTCASYEDHLLVGGVFVDMSLDAAPPSPPRILGSADVRQINFGTDGEAAMLVHLFLNQTTTYGTALVPPQAAQAYAAPEEPGWSLPGLATMAGVGAFAALFGVLYLFWPALKALFVGGYARGTGQELLNHPVRQRLMQAIEAQPGIHLKEVSRVAGLAWGQTQHHMRKLVDAGLVVAKPSAGYTCYFPQGQGRHVMASAAVLKADGARRLFHAIASTTGLSMGQLSRMAGLTESTAHYHLRRLEAAGLVTTQRYHGARRVMLTALGTEAGRAYAPSSVAG